MAGSFDIIIEQGSTWSMQMLIEDIVAGVATPRDLTGYTGAMKIKASASSTTELASASFALSATPIDGKFTLSLSALQTSGIPTTGATFNAYADYVYDVTLTSGGVTKRIVNGLARVSPGVTK